jgi:hypothetical protein
MRLHRNRRGVIVRYAAGLGLFIIPGVTWWMTNNEPAWITMWALAGGIFLALKLITVTAVTGRSITFYSAMAYVLLWPGMDAEAFLNDRMEKRPAAPLAELGFAFLKLIGGVCACGWASQQVSHRPPLLVGWVGMVGIIFILHFGMLHAVSWGWRRLGRNAPPIMRAPIAADSLTAFWGGRWNAAFADVARRFIFRPTARRLGARGAGALVFLVSGLVHEVAISLPAKGGWGGPTVYFLLQGAGMILEKSDLGDRMGVGAGLRGWILMAIFTIAPLPLLFHPPFIHGVILPFLRALNQLYL